MLLLVVPLEESFLKNPFSYKKISSTLFNNIKKDTYSFSNAFEQTYPEGYGWTLDKGVYQIEQDKIHLKADGEETFYVKTFIDSFWDEPGLKRSLDKIYEIIVYALFSTLVEAMNLEVEITVEEDAYPLLKEFEDFTQKVMCLDCSTPQHIQEAKVYRVGVTNAADRGLDMYSNWGPAIQIKHLSLDLSLAESIVNSVSSDRIVIVCKDAEKDVIVSLLSQIGWRSHIQSIVTESDLINWYEKALRGSYSDSIGDTLLYTLAAEIAEEFPSVDNTPDILKDRHYELISDPFWK